MNQVVEYHAAKTIQKYFLKHINRKGKYKKMYFLFICSTYLWPKLIIRNFMMNIVRKRMSADIIHNFLSSNQQSSLSSFLRDYVFKVKIVL